MAAQGNVIDSLVVLLGLDKSNFDKGQKEAQAALGKTREAAANARKDHEDQAKRTAEAYGKVRDSIMGVTAAIVTAVAGGEFLSFLTKNDIAAGNLATNVGSVVKEVSTLQGVFRRIGGSTGDADAFLRTTNKILQDIRFTGTSQALLPFAQFGLNTAAFRDAKTMEDRLLMLSDAAKKMDPMQAQYRLQAAGFSESQINLMLRGRVAIQQLIDEQQKLNVESEKDYELAKRRQDAWSGLQEALIGFGRSIARETTPVIETISNILTKFVSYLSTDGGSAAASIVLLAGGIAKLAGAMGIAGTAASALLARLGLFVAAAAGLYQIIHLIDAGAQLLGISTRQGVTLNSETQARIAAGALNGLPDPFHSSGVGSSGGTLGARNNNPGNLRFANQIGATQGAGGFAAFGSVAEGLAALESQLTLDGGTRGMTLAQMIAKYAPPGENNTSAYIADVSRRTGISPNSVPNVGDPATMHSLMMAFSAHEGNPQYADSINQGMNLAMRQGRGVGAPNVTVGNVTIQTTSSTMTGTGADLGKGLNNYLVAQQANNGVN